MTTLIGLYPLSEEKAVVQKLRSLYLSIIREERKGVLPSLVLLALSPFSYSYYVLLRLRELLYRYGILESVPLPVPVISVGNITMGGTGKTPLLELLTKFLLDRGKKVAILSRGYAGMKVGENQVNDEYLEFAERLPSVPILLGRDRLSSAREALKDYRPDCLLLDDGFQHWKLARNLDIVVIDGLEPFGNGGLVPAGILREPPNNLARANLLILSHTDLCKPIEIQAIKKRLSEIDSHIPVLEAVHHPLYLEDVTGRRLEIPWLKGKKVYAFCGLGNPRSFEKTLQLTGADVETFKDFPDHHHYSTNDMAAISAEAARLGVDAVVTTQKDLVKIKNTINQVWQNPPLLSLRVEMRITNGFDVLSEKLEKVIT
ncbi:MAG: tetraacyldisaccharide 4'-kinase [Candidatus Brocadiales bacterium]